MFIKNIWYVAAWLSELEDDKVIGRTIANEPIAIWRDSKKKLVAMEDRCPHRHAALSLGKPQGDSIQCMYHGMKFSSTGKCQHVPGSDIIPPNSDIATFPVVEKYDWIWIWLGDPKLADESKIPDSFAADQGYIKGDKGILDYEANYQLINDNLTDLSHADFVHETSLGRISGRIWSDDRPTVKNIENGLCIQRWLDKPLDPNEQDSPDHWNSYHYMLPGIFLQTVEIYPPGTAEKCGHQAPSSDIPPLFTRYDQQAVTPINDHQTRYFFTPVVNTNIVGPDFDFTGDHEMINTAFAEDRIMIEAQQKIWNLTSPDKKKAFIAYDQAPSMFRKIIENRLKEENQ